jgi:hypothetical protein
VGVTAKPVTVADTSPAESLNAKRTLAGVLASLEETGQARAAVDGLTIDVDEWCSLAEQAGRLLDRPVETTVTGNHVVAVVKDWPRDSTEWNGTLGRLRGTLDTMKAAHAAQN